MGGIPKKVLIITEYIAPVQAVASIRWTKFAKYLVKDFGYDVTVLTNRKSFKKGLFQSKPYQKDAALDKDTKWFNCVEIPYSSSQFVVNGLFNAGRNMLDAVKKHAAGVSKQDEGAESDSFASTKNQTSSIVETTLISSFPEMVFELVDGWCGKAICRSAIAAPIEWESYDVIISTYAPFWTHRVARAVKSQYPSISWIADFRDPIVNSPRTDTKKNRNLAREITTGADAVTAVSQGTLDNLFLDSQILTSVLVNGFDPEEVSGAERGTSDRFSLVYTGTLYSDNSCKRDLAPLFKALDKAISSGRIDKDKIVFEYAGTTSYLFERFSRMYPNVPTIDHGLLSRDKALELQSRSSLLVVASWNTFAQRGVLTGKVFEYLSKDVPIIGLCSGDVPNSSLRSLIEECSAGICYEEADESTHSLLIPFLEQQYRQWKNRGITTRGLDATERVVQYSYPRLAERLVCLMKQASKPSKMNLPSS